MIEFFWEISILIILHLISVAVWIGGMIVMRFAVHYSILKLMKQKLGLREP